MNFIITTKNGTRTWSAHNEHHALALHDQAFLGQEGEEAISIASAPISTGTSLVPGENLTPQAAPDE